jgi:predicted RecB family nuclease
LVLPVPDWSLKSVARWCGFPESAAGEPDLDGFEVGLLYEEFRRLGATLPVAAIRQYNVLDVLALAHVTGWVRDHHVVV